MNVLTPYRYNSGILKVGTYVKVIKTNSKSAYKLDGKILVVERVSNFIYFKAIFSAMKDTIVSNKDIDELKVIDAPFEVKVLNIKFADDCRRYGRNIDEYVCKHVYNDFYMYTRNSYIIFPKRFDCSGIKVITSGFCITLVDEFNKVIYSEDVSNENGLIYIRNFNKINKIN